MAHYLLQAAYTPEAWGAFEKSPEDRIEAIRPFVEAWWQSNLRLPVFR